MPYVKPGISELIDQQFADLLSLLKDADPTLRDSKLEIFAKVMAGGINGGYSYLDWILLQIFPDTADPEFSGKWGFTKNLTPLDAKSASGTVIMSGNVGAGCVIGDELRRDDGQLYLTTESAVIPGSGSISVAVVAVEPGVLGNTDVAVLLTWTSVPAGVNSTVVVEDMTGGTDDETDAEYSVRVVDSFRNPARGGSESDYVIWAKESGDVTNVWIRSYDPGDNPDNVLLGDLLLYFMMYDTYADGIPQAGDVTKVKDYIDARRPLGMGDFTVVAPVSESLDLTMAIVPDTLQGRNEVTEQLDDYIRREAQPNGVLYLSNINEAISRAISVDRHSLTVPAGDVQPATANAIFFLGTITWA
jgi:uncharacterized phage protein gp47/JayE